MTRGLVLGKFAPLHRGHQLLIERSLADCDRTVILPFYILGGPSGYKLSQIALAVDGPPGIIRTGGFQG